METKAVESSEVRADKLALIRKWSEAGEDIPAADGAWLLAELAALEEAKAKAEAAHASLQSAAGKHVSGSQAAKSALTLWLAVRGSNDEAFFKATATLAAQTVKVLND